MKTFIIYFVAILGVIEAHWRVTDNDGLRSYELSDFKGYVRWAMLQRGNDFDMMDFLRVKMEQNQ